MGILGWPVLCCGGLCTVGYLAAPVVSAQWMSVPTPLPNSDIPNVLRRCQMSLRGKIIPGWEPLLRIYFDVSLLLCFCFLKIPSSFSFLKGIFPERRILGYFLARLKYNLLASVFHCCFWEVRLRHDYCCFKYKLFFPGTFIVFSLPLVVLQVPLYCV